MKLLISESKAFNKAIEQSTLNREDISFTKKSGWLNVKHQTKQGVFSYHRKRKIELSKEGQWDKSHAYFIKREKKQLEMKNFDAVLNEFRVFLGSLK